MNILFLYPKTPDTFWSFRHVLRFSVRQAIELAIVGHRFRRVAQFL